MNTFRSRKLYACTIEPINFFWLRIHLLAKITAKSFFTGYTFNLNSIYHKVSCKYTKYQVLLYTKYYTHARSSQSIIFWARIHVRAKINVELFFIYQVFDLNSTYHEFSCKYAKYQVLLYTKYYTHARSSQSIIFWAGIHVRARITAQVVIFTGQTFNLTHYFITFLFVGSKIIFAYFI